MEAFSVATNEDGTIAAASCLPKGPWYMENIYQYWVFLEINLFFSNFIGIILTLAVLSFNPPAIKRCLTVPMALVQEINQTLLANIPASVMQN